MITPSFSLTATERVLPKLALDFTTTALDSRITFTRSGNTATVVNSLGLVAPINADLPRFDYDPVALTCKGLLIEESRANLFLYSDQLQDATWVKSSVTVDDDAIASPDGTTNADKVIVDSGVASASGIIRQQITKAASAITYTNSFYAKAGEFNSVRVIFRDTGNSANFVQAFFNLSLGTVSTAANAGGTYTNPSASISNAGNGWYRCTLTGTTGTATTVDTRILQYNNGNTAITGDGVSGLYVWGAQLETGAFATSYIPTVASQVTRNADVATMTGTNFSDWYNQSEGTFITQGIFLGTGASGATRVWQADAGGEGDRLTVITTSTSFRCISTVSSVSQADFSVSYGGASIQNSGFAYKTNDIQLSANATLGAGDNSCAIPTVSTFRIGASFSGVFGASLIRKISFFPLRLLNAELQAFTN